MPRHSNALMTMAAFIIVIAGAKAAQAIVAPFLLAVFIAVISAPLLLWLEGHGVPRILSFIVVTAGVVGVFMGIGVIIGNSMDGFLTSLPELQIKLSAFSAQALEWVQQVGIPLDISALPAGLDPANVLNTAGSFLKSTTKILSSSFLIFLMVTFMLFETVSLRAKLHILSEKSPQNLEAVELFMKNLKRYLAIKSLASVATGVIIGVALSFLGIKYALLWGMIALLMNYIPTIGSVLAAIPVVLVTLAEGDWQQVLWVVAVFALVNVMIGNFIEPRFMGKGLGISTLVVLLSLLFWGWVLGSVGMFLAIPLTMSMKIALDVNPKTQWISLLISDYRGNSR